MVVRDNQGIRVGAGFWALAFGRALGFGPQPAPRPPRVVRQAGGSLGPGPGLRPRAHPKAKVPH